MAELFGGDMQFDVIIGNPPYQLDDGGYGTSAAPIYQLFVEKALDLDPRYAVFVTPSRWMAGGKGLDKYRERMLSDKRMRSIVDYPKLYEGFPGREDSRRHLVLPLGSRPQRAVRRCRQSGTASRPDQPVARHLDAYDILVRRNEAVPILGEGQGQEASPRSMLASPARKPFGLRTFFHGKPDAKRSQEPREALRIPEESAGSSARKFQRTPRGSTSGKC